jgi:hypothetical protein
MFVSQNENPPVRGKKRKKNNAQPGYRLEGFKKAVEYKRERKKKGHFENM